MERKRRSGAFGVVYQDVMRNKNLKPAAKGLYAYLSAFCGDSDTCFPSVDTITKEMCMGKDTFYKHIDSLVAAGVVVKVQDKNQEGKFDRVIYKVTHEITIDGKTKKPNTKKSDTVKPNTAAKETNNNNTNKNSINNNSNKSSTRFTPPTVEEVRAYCQERKNNIDPEHFVDYYTSTGWIVGRKKMKDWKASVRTWERNDYGNVKQEQPRESKQSFEHYEAEIPPEVLAKPIDWSEICAPMDII